MIERTNELPASVQRSVDRQYLTLERFTQNENARGIPRRLLGNLLRGEYVRLTIAEREVSLRATIEALALADWERRRAARTGPTVPAPAPAPAAPAPVASAPMTPARYSVSCAGECGTLCPASGPRAVVAYCEPCAVRVEAASQATVRRRARTRQLLAA